jgi:small-conductance mechanosensitive channel
LVKINVPVGVSYGADPHKVVAIVEEEALQVDRVLSDPPPRCRLACFGDSSVDFNALLWINDPQRGVYGPRHDFLLRVWDRFKKEGIEIPFPQRDLHLRSISEGVAFDIHAEPPRSETMSRATKPDQK